MDPSAVAGAAAQAVQPEAVPPSLIGLVVAVTTGVLALIGKLVFGLQKTQEGAIEAQNKAVEYSRSEVADHGKQLAGVEARLGALDRTLYDIGRRLDGLEHREREAAQILRAEAAQLRAALASVRDVDPAEPTPPPGPRPPVG